MRRGSRSFLGAALACAALMLLGCMAPRAIADGGSLSMDRPAQPIDPAEHVALTERASEDAALQELRSGQGDTGNAMLQMMGAVLLVAIIVALVVVANEDEDDW